MSDCIFCRILKGEIPSTKVYEDDLVYAFLDIAPINKGHTLVIPKNHSENLYTMPEADLVACAKVCQKIASVMKKAVNAEGVNLGMNNEKPAGQLVPHAHFHVIPRFASDGLHHWPGGKYDQGEDTAIAEKISGLL